MIGRSGTRKYWIGGVVALVWLLSGAAHATGSVGQIDASRAIERVTIAANGRLYAWDQTGALLAGWPKDPSGPDRRFMYVPRLIDIDLDQEQEIVAVSAAVGGGQLIMHVFKGDGTELPTWQFPIPQSAVVTTPVIADLDHDSSLDIAYATPEPAVHVVRRDFSPLPNFSKSFAATPYLAVGDPDNDGLANLFATVGGTVLTWDEVGTLTTLHTLPAGEEIIGGASIVDIDRDFYPDLLLTTTASRIVGLDQHGLISLDLAMPEGVQLIAPLVVEDIDVDRLPELIVLTDQQALLAFEPNGAAVVGWSLARGYRQPAPSGGVVANDAYRGLFASGTGWDQRDLYRTQSHAYGQILVGEQVREWDTFAHFDFLQPIEVFDLFTFPKPFTPNDDGVNDTTTVHYRLSADALVALDLYDAHERFLARIQEKAPRGAGEHSEIWHGINTQGTATRKDDVPLDTGLYLLKVVAESPEGFVSQATVSAIVNGVKAEIETPTDDDEMDALYPTIFGVATLMGIATDPNFGENHLDADFQAYKVYYRPGIWGMSPDEVVTVGQAGSPWRPLEVPLRHQCLQPTALEPNDLVAPHSNVSCRPVQHGILGSFDTTNPVTTPNGEYTLLLKVTDSAGNTVGKVNYDTVVVTVANPNPGDPYDPNNPFDRNNPNNPIYQGPALSNLSLTNALITKQQPATTIAYVLEHETADIHITIYPEGQGANAPVAAIYSFNALAPNHPGNPTYSMVWNGTNTLGRPVSGGTYRVQIAAYAVDGTGSDTQDGLQLNVAKGFAASDVLGVTNDPVTGQPRFTATPSHFNPLGFGTEGPPEQTFLDYELTKEAKVTIQVLEAVPDQGLVLHKTLRAGVVQQFDDGQTFWDGSGANGLILPVDRDYLVRLTAESLDIGNAETLQYDVVVHLDAATLDGAVAADLQQLRGDAGELVQDDQALVAMVGNPDFLWRAVGTGYVEMPFTYEISGQAENQTKTTETQTHNSVGWKEMQVCQYYSDCDFFDTCQDHVTPRTTTIDVALPQDFSVLTVTAQSASTPRTAAVPTWQQNGSTVTGQIVPVGPFDPGDWGQFTDQYGRQTTAIALWGCDQAQRFAWYLSPDCDPPPLGCFDKSGFSIPCPPPPLPKCQKQDPANWPCSADGEGVLWTCGTASLQVTGTVPKTSTCKSPMVTVSGEGVVLSTQGSIAAATFSGNLGICASGEDGAVIPGTTFNAKYTLQLKNRINGIDGAALHSGSANDGYLTIAGLRGWLGTASGPTFHADGTYNSAAAFVAIDPPLADGYFTNRDDDYLKNAPDWKIWGTYTDFNEEFYRQETRPIGLYAEGYQPNVFSGSPGTATLYSFSDRVHLTGWDMAVRYPNITVDQPDGDNALDTGDGHRDVFHLESVQVTPAGTRGTQNSNIEDTFRLRLKPQAVPRRYVEIHGTATANYELYFYDNDTQIPQWRSIPPRTPNAVTNGLLAHWDVTGLNGEHYTVVLQGANGNQVNLDTMDVAIGTRVDTSGLGPNEFVRVYSTFKKASLIFGAGALPQGPQLVTITPVRPDEAAFALPSGIAPLGPIFDIQPDDIVIAPAHHVQLELVFTPTELQEAFGVDDPSELTIYNLSGPQALEGLATIATLNDMDDDDPTNDVWQFTASLEHFSQYFLARRVAGFIQLEAPASDAYLHGVVTIAGRVESAPRPVDAPDTPQPLATVTALTITAYPEGQPAQAVTIGTGGAEFSLPWDVSVLNGNYRLRIEAQGPAGAAAAIELPVAIDNSPTQTTLLVNGLAVADGATLGVAPGAIVELKATDHQSAPWQTGVKTIEYGLDGTAWIAYEQPFHLAFTEGTHTVAYRAIDQNENVEATRTAALLITEQMPADQAAGMAVQLTLDGPHVPAPDHTWVSPATNFALALANGSPAQIRYRLGGSDYLPYTAPVQLRTPTEGPYILEYFAIDQLGLRSPIQTRALFLDRSPPLTTITPNGLALAQGAEWVIAPATTLSFSAQDQGELPVGVERIEYRLGEAAWQISDGPLAFPATTTLAVRAIDHVGNSEPPQAWTIRIDDTAPSFQVISVPTVLSPNGDGRHDNAEVIVTVADNLYTTFDLTMVLTDPAGQTVTPFAAVPLSAGTNTLMWDGFIEGAVLPEAGYDYAITVRDAGGNAAQVVTGTVRYDVTPPQLQLVGSAVQAFSPNADAVQDVLTITYALTDNLFADQLAVRLQVITVESEPILATEVITGTAPPEQQLTWNGSNAAINAAFDGTYHFALVAEDPAGNRTTPQPGEVVTGGAVLVDRLAPATTVTITGPSYRNDLATWLGPEATLTLQAQDPVVGAGVQQIVYAFDEAPWSVYTAPIVLLQEDVTYDFRYRATDWVGNQEVLHSTPVRADWFAPISTLQIGTPQEPGPDSTDAASPIIFVSPQTPLAWEATDGAGVGVQAVWTELTGAQAPSTYEVPIVLNGLGDGAYELRYWAEDYLENRELTRTQTVVLDGTPPVTTLLIGTPQEAAADGSLAYVRTVTPLSFSAVTERNDLAGTEYRIDDGPWQPAAPFTLPAEGTYRIAYRSHDRLQNMEAERSQVLVVDETPPVASVGLSQSPQGGGADVTPLTQFTLSATATGSQASGLEYQIDDGPWLPYTQALTLAGRTPGHHVIRYRVRDGLGNESAVQSVAAHLIDLEITRAQRTLPRVLVFMLQTHDVRAEDPHPNAALITALAEELGGYWTVIDGDHNDPATVDRFLAELRTDKYSTILLATDAFVVKFFDTAKVVGLMNEVKARIYKGDTLLSLIGYSAIDSPVWTRFVADFRPRTAAAATHVAALAPALAVRDQQYGRGAVVAFGGDVGRLAEANATARAEILSGLVTLVSQLIPAEDETNHHEVVDYTLTYRNHGDHPVAVETGEQWPEGWIETRATGAEVAVSERHFALNIPARATRVVDYLYRAAQGPGEGTVSTQVASTWEHGLRSSHQWFEPYRVAANVPMLFDRVIGPEGFVRDGAMPAVAALLRQARQRFLLAPGAGATAAEIDAVMRLLLEAIDLLPPDEARADAVHTAIAELVEVVGAQQAYGALTINLAVSQGDPNDPASFHGDTASYVSGGSGGCRIMTRREHSSVWGTMVGVLGYLCMVCLCAIVRRRVWSRC